MDGKSSNGDAPAGMEATMHTLPTGASLEEAKRPATWLKGRRLGTKSLHDGK
jgi:hypothetical protein